MPARFKENFPIAVVAGAGVSVAVPSFRARKKAALQMPSWRSLFAVAWASSFVSGCVGYQPEPLIPAETARTIEDRNLDDARLKQFVALAVQRDGNRPLAWNLTTLTAAALYYHPDLPIAQAKLAAAKAAVITAKERPNPVLNFTNIVGQGLVAEAIPAGAAPLTIGPTIDFLVETFGKREARTAEAQHLLDAARWDLATAGWQVRGRVRAALLNLWAAQQRLTLTRQRLALQDQLVDLLEHRLTAGEASSLDVSRERINRAQITYALHDLDQSVAEARVQLATAIGVPVRALDGVTLTTNVFDHPPLPSHPDSGIWRREALTRRSDVQASLAAYEGTQSSLQLAIADQFPNLILSPGYSYEYGINQYQLNLSTTLPIFNQNQGKIAEALAKRQEAAAAFNALQAQIIGQIDQAATAYRKSTQTLASADALRADEQRRAQQMESSFNAGQTDRPSLVATQMEAAATAMTGFDAVVQQRQALGALEDALQRPLYGPDPLLSTAPSLQPSLAAPDAPHRPSESST